MKEMNYYHKAITLASLKVHENGHDVMGLGEDPVQTKINKRLLVLPTKEMLTEADWENKIPFHPLCEASILNKRSIILDRFIELANFTVDSHVRLCMQAIITMICDKDTTIPPDALAAIADISQSASQTTLVGDFNKVFLDPIKGKVKIPVTERVVTVTLKRNQQENGKKYRAVAKLICPTYDESDDDKHFMGVKCKSKNNAATLKALFNYLVDGLDDLDKYSTRTNTTTAALWTAYTKTLGKFHEHLNAVKELFELGELFEPIDTGFLEMNEAAVKLKQLIPALEDSRGVFEDDEVPDVKSPNEPAEKPVQRAQETKPKDEATVNAFMRSFVPEPQSNRFVSEPEPQRSSGNAFMNYCNDHSTSRRRGRDTGNDYNRFGGGRRGRSQSIL